MVNQGQTVWTRWRISCNLSPLDIDKHIYLNLLVYKDLIKPISSPVMILSDLVLKKDSLYKRGAQTSRLLSENFGG